MKNIFTLAERVLYQTDIEEKLQITEAAYSASREKTLSLVPHSAVKAISQVSFPRRPELLLPKQMPRRSLHTTEGQAAFFHALAHIEFVAIYLAWDIIYRFRNLPEKFYQDWLQVAAEEVLHFQLLRRHLQQFGIDYGDLPAHRGLWDHAVDTKDDLLARLAIVPRCMEARGLDVTPAMIEKFKNMQDADSVTLLSTILEDEVGHVKIGSYWFKFFCQQQQKDFKQSYRDLLDQYFIGKPKGPFNREMRIIAGFAPDEIDWLEQHA
jgi:uncharacterized ferritin-like protein (DUF455 family)